ncbi:MAG TPA: beta-ketoacyl-[acyl-carrier-protein] synthase family protein [Candidatus Omnitrophota bacterium]|nr:beta-ketoacyl-[acyl-carrier-protein] synthase family protein [Candidatus Omnitrophota bacterium]HPS37056.1 beta-ketoacyl-[acyl-carrier-protein] synthase family protein [Candidatus Omnitrophota bacterium]
MSTRRRVVVTGFGVITPCGNGWESYWDAAVHARSAVRSAEALNLGGFPLNGVGRVTEFEPKDYVENRKSLKLMSREISFAVAASRLALRDAKLSAAECDPTRIGVTLGTGIINNDLDEMGVGFQNGVDANGHFSMTKFGQDGIRALFPLWFLKYLPNMPACHVSILNQLRGPSNTITTSTAASTQAIGESYRVIERGDADIMLAGGTDSKVNAMGISRLHLLGFLSKRTAAPEKVYCPFDENHDGIVIGEGAGILVLESYEHAKKRGVNIYAEISGYGSASDHNYDPRDSDDFTGKRVALRRALEDAALDPEDVDVLVANGSGIPQEDVQEALAIHSLYPKDFGKLRVTAVKPVTGNLLYGSGGVEAVIAALIAKQQIVPPVANLEKQDPLCSLPFVRGKAESCQVNSVVLNTFGFGGQNASLVFKHV